MNIMLIPSSVMFTLSLEGSISRTYAENVKGTVKKMVTGENDAL